MAKARPAPKRSDGAGTIVSVPLGTDGSADAGCWSSASIVVWRNDSTLRRWLIARYRSDKVSP